MLLHHKLKDRRLILASKSPRRRQLMAGCDLEFEVADCYEAEETYPSSLEAEEVPVYLARVKSEAYPVPLSDKDILTTADTVVILDGCILGKPADREDAMNMLFRLSGREHTVITGVALRSNEKYMDFSASTKVRFRNLRLEEIEYYTDRYRPYDKAGGYGIQEWIGYVGIESVEGSFYNVMGLPVQSLYINLDIFTE